MPGFSQFRITPAPEMARYSSGASSRGGKKTVLNIDRVAAFEAWLLLPDQAALPTEVSFPRNLGADNPTFREGSSQQEAKV